MKTVSNLLAAASLVALGGCATVIKGTTQDIAVDTNPQGASCTVSRSGAQLAVLDVTPGKIQVSRDKDPLLFSCTASGASAPATQTLESKFNGATIGNVLAGGLIGVVVDASTGANYSYPEQVTIDVMANAAAPVTSTPLAPTTSSTTTKTPDGTVTMKPVQD